MPFPSQTARPFTRNGIEALAPGQRGVYGIYKSNLWIYVGKGDLRANLLAHFNGDNPDIIKYGPTYFVTEVTANLDNREKQLIVELSPVANKRVG